MASENLWGSIPAADDTESPSTILRGQAAILTEQTHNLLQGIVATSTDGGITIEFSVRSPFLNNYEITLVRARHGAIMYPVNLFNLLESVYRPIECEDADDFKRALGEILQSAKVRKIISSLLAQSK